MNKFKIVRSVCAPLPLINIDTDMIIPKQFLKTIKRSGLGIHAFAEMRYHEDGTENLDFILNKSNYRNAQIIITGDNFGCGSSREHAPWAISDLGIKVIISTSFADIFYNNCFKNGILPIILSQDKVDLLMSNIHFYNNFIITVNLIKQEIEELNGNIIKFDIDGFKKHCLLNGLDDIGLTLKKESAIINFETKMLKITPWI